MTETIGWGLGLWGTSWGIDRTDYEGPIIIRKAPGAGARDVSENTPIVVQFFDPTFDLNTQSIDITINGVQAYSGLTGFSAGFFGKTDYAAGALTVQVQPRVGFAFSEIVSVTAFGQDSTLLETYEAWAFTIRANPVCYTGLKPLEIETALQSPFTRFISLERYRQVFLDNALKPQRSAVSNRDNKAARAVYKAAYSTELSTLLNPYLVRNTEALNSTVCEQQSLLGIDRTLADVSKNIVTDIRDFHRLSGLDAAYLTVFNDYADSTLYTYRVSLLANMLLFAKAYELAQE